MLFFWTKAAGTWCWPPPSGDEVKNEWSYTYTPPVRLSGADGHNIHFEPLLIHQDISMPPSCNAVHDWLLGLSNWSVDKSGGLGGRGTEYGNTRCLMTECFLVLWREALLSRNLPVGSETNRDTTVGRLAEKRRRNLPSMRQDDRHCRVEFDLLVAARYIYRIKWSGVAVRYY
jgi:hypothetical protein